MNSKLQIYFKTPLGTLYKGDALDILPKLNIKADLIITDPPYGISKNNKIIRKKGLKYKGGDVNYNFGKWDMFNNKNDFLKFTFSWLKSAVKLLRAGRIIISFYDEDKINFISQYLQNQGFNYKGYFRYLKLNPMPQARKVKFMNGCETAGIWQKSGGELVFNYKYGQQKDYILAPVCSGNEREEHPTQKPESVIMPLIKYWALKDEIILDPFMGSGTTALICEKLNMRWIGIESDEKYCDIIKNRILRFTRLGRLF